jgi:P-type Ca2+ transporter type 2C
LHRPFANKWLNLAIAWEMLLLCLVVYLPFFQHAIGTSSLPLEDWLNGGAVALTICPVLELVKLIERRGWLGPLP